MSVLVADEHYAQVSKWVDKTHLGNRLVYHRVSSKPASRASSGGSPGALVRKLSFKHDSPFATWVEAEVTRRFNPVCCDSLEEFRREKEALTLNGQLKGGLQHSKDDRFRVDDRTRYILGWTNQEKLAALHQQEKPVEQRAQAAADQARDAGVQEQALSQRADALKLIVSHRSFEDLDWHQSVRDLEGLERELRELEGGSDVLRALEKELKSVEGQLGKCEATLSSALGAKSAAATRRAELQKQRARAQTTADAATEEQRALASRIDALWTESAVGRQIDVDSAIECEQQLREWLQKRIDSVDAKQKILRDGIVRAMEAYKVSYPVETREADANVEAGDEFRKMLATLRDDDLPRFEKQFKELLNENTIIEVASFQSQLRGEREDIAERIDTINKSLRVIPFNPGRYIRLEAESSTDAEVRDFQAELKACTEGTLSGSADDTYSEAKFLQVKKIIDRFRGREGSTDGDARWTQKVTDVRNWFSFAASERWAEDDKPYEHYTDSGGKSGGQKEKLAYTVLAASLAYQFGLEFGETRSRSFRFVVIDEAFGRGSDESATYGLQLFKTLNLQLLVVTPLQKIHVIEPFVAHVGFVSNRDGQRSKLLNFTIEEFREEQARRGA